MPDFIDPFAGNFLAPTVPAPDIAVTGGKSTASLPQDLIPKPAPASSLVQPPTSIVTPPAPPAQTPFVDPFASSSTFVDPFEKANPPRQSLGDLMFPPGSPVAPTAPKPSLTGELGKGIMQGLYQFKEMGGGLMALAGEAMKSASSVMEPIAEPLKEFGIETLQSAQKGMEPYQGAVPSYKNIGGVNDALLYLSHGIGSLLPMIAMSTVSGGVGAAAGKALARNYVTTLATRMAAQGISKEIINEAIKTGLMRGLTTGAGLGGYASSLAFEVGSVTAEKVQGKQDIEPLRVMMGAVPAAALDVLPELSLVKRTGILKRLGLSKAEAALAEEAAKKIPGSFLGRIGKEAGKQFLMEAPTEAMQSVLERWAEKKDLTAAESIDDYIDSFLIGGAGGALFGGLGGAFEKPGQAQTGQPSPTQGPIPPVIPPAVPPEAPAAPALPTTAPGMIPSREAIIQNPPEKTIRGAAINIEPGRPIQPDTVDMEAWQAMKQGRWMDFIGQNIQPKALSQIEQIQRDMGLVVKDGKVFQVGPNGEAIPLSPEKEEAATWALTHRLRVVDDFLKFINQAPVTRPEAPKQLAAPPALIPTPGVTIPPGPGGEPSPVPPSPAPPPSATLTPPGLAPTPPGPSTVTPAAPGIPVPTPEVGKPPVIGPNLPQEGTLGKPPVTTLGVIPAPKAPQVPPQPAPEKAPVTVPKAVVAAIPVREQKAPEAPPKVPEIPERELKEKEPLPAAAPVSPEGPVLPLTETPAPVKEVQTPRGPAGPILPEQARRLEEIRKENPEEAARIEKGNVAVGIQQYELARIGKAKQMRQAEFLNQSKVQERLIPALKPEFRQRETVPKYYNLEDKVNLQNEFFEAGKRGESGAREYFASLDEQRLKAIAEANAQNPNMAREKLLDRMAHYANRAAENIGFGLTGRIGEAHQGPFLQQIPRSWREYIETGKMKNGQDWVSFLANNAPSATQRVLAQALLANKSIVSQLRTLPFETFYGKVQPSHYDRNEKLVRINLDGLYGYTADYASGVILEEAIHGITADKLSSSDEFFSGMTRLREISRRALSVKEYTILASKNRWESVDQIKSAGLREHDARVYYALQNNEEFLVHIFKSKPLQDFLKTIPIPEGAIRETGKAKTLWDRIWEFISKVLFGSPDYNTVLKEGLTLGAEIMQAAPETLDTSTQSGGGENRLYSLPPEMQENIAGLTHPDFPGNVAEDPKFDPYLGKHRFLIHLNDPDLKRWKEIGVLPYWLAKEYPEFTPFLQSQERREEKRSEIRTEKLKQKEPFTFLKGDNLSRTEAAIVAGDAEERTWTDAELIDRFNLSPEGIEAYKSVRATFDNIFQENLDRAELAILENAQKSIDSTFAKLTNKIESHKESEQKDVILGLLKTAHDLILSNDEITSLANLMGETKEAIEKPLKTVRDKMVKIFNEVLTEKDKAKLLSDYESAYEKAQAPIGEIREIIHNALGGDIDRANLDEITKGLVWAYIRTERPANTLKELRAEFGKTKGYLPRDHGRGKYEIFVTQDTFDERGQPQKRVIWNHFFGQFEGTKVYKQMKLDREFNKSGMEIGIRLHKEESDSSFWRASLANLQRLTDNSIEELKQKGTITPDLAEDIKYQILYELSDQFKARGAARHFIHRADYLIKGYKTTGINEVINDYISGWAGMITKQDAAGEFLEAMKGIPKDKPKLKNYAFQYTENMLRNDENTDRVLGKMRGLIFTYFLGGSLRGGIVNSTQSLTMTIPHLAREVGWKGLRAEGLVLGSAKDIAINRLSQVERRLLDDAHDKGTTEAQYINEIIREAGDRFGKTLGKVVTLLGKPFAFFETKNRQIAALSYFRAKMPEMLKTMAEEEAYQKILPDAIDFVNRTQFMMTKGNLPNWASGADVGSQFFRTAYTFRKFNHNFILSLRNSFRGPDGKIALDVIGRSLAYLVLLGGLPALPFLDDLLDEWEKIFGQPVRREIKQNLSAIGGPALEKMGMMGIPAILGIDISGSLKLGIPFVGTPSENIFGIWAGLGQKFMRAKDSAQRKDILRAIESASPAFLESMLKAYRMTEQGATTPTGKIIYDEKGQPIKETVGEGITQAFGFRPERISEASRTHREFANIESNFKKRMDDLYARFRLAKDAGERKKVIQDVQKYNLEAIKHRGAVPMINAQNLRESFVSKPEKRYLLWGAQS